MDFFTMGCWITAFCLAAAFLYLVTKYGTVNVDPQQILIRRNVITGGLKEMGPGLKFFIPGVYENFAIIDCRHVVLDLEPLTVTSRDGQPVSVDYQVTLWVDGFQENVIKKGQAIKAISRIGEQIGTGTETQISTQQSRKNMEILGLKESNVAIQNMIGNYPLELLIGAKAPLSVPCPFCGEEIKGGDPDRASPTALNTRCPDKHCEMNEKKMEVPAGFYERLSFSAGVRLHNEILQKAYGLGCLLKIRNVSYPKDIERAARAEKIADMEGRATKARFEKETEAFQNLITKTGTNPNIAFMGGKLAEVIPEIVAALIGNKKGEKK